MEGKKSFLLHCDFIHGIDELSDEQAGKLLKIIFQYVNDQNPVIEDQILRIAFTPIKLALKRDLDTWKKSCDKNKENGLKGGRPPKENPTEPKKPSGLIGNPTEPKKADKDKDKDSDTNNISLKENHIEIFRKLYQDQAWIEGLCMKFKCEVSEARKHLIDFKDSTILKEEWKEDTSDAKKHFFNWINKGNPIPTNKPEKIILQSSRTALRNPE